MSRRRRIVGALALAVLVLVLGAAVLGPRLGNAPAGAQGIHDVAALPRQILLCNRSWLKDDLERGFTLAEADQMQDGGAPVVVDPDVSDACPPGPCSNVAQTGACDTVIWVRVGEDAYLDYSLQGGP